MFCQYIQVFSPWYQQNYFVVAKKSLPIWMYGWLGKIWRNIITRKIKFLRLLKHERYYWYRLHASVCKHFEIKNLEAHYDLYDRSDILSPSNVFENFRNMSLDLYELYSSRFLNTPGLAWQAALKNTKVKLDLLIDIDMSLMVDKGIRGQIFYVIHRYIKTSNRYMKNYLESK